MPDSGDSADVLRKFLNGDNLVDIGQPRQHWRCEVDPGRVGVVVNDYREPDRGNGAEMGHHFIGGRGMGRRRQAHYCSAPGVGGLLGPALRFSSRLGRDARHDLGELSDAVHCGLDDAGPFVVGKGLVLAQRPARDDAGDATLGEAGPVSLAGAEVHGPITLEQRGRGHVHARKSRLLQLFHSSPYRARDSDGQVSAREIQSVSPLRTTASHGAANRGGQ